MHPMKFVKGWFCSMGTRMTMTIQRQGRTRVMLTSTHAHVHGVSQSFHTARSVLPVPLDPTLSALITAITTPEISSPDLVSHFQELSRTMLALLSLSSSATSDHATSTPRKLSSGLQQALNSIVHVVHPDHGDHDPTTLKNLCYGTTPPSTILTIMDHLYQQHTLLPGGDFLDVGCGNGDVVVTAAHHPTMAFKTCRGFDLVPARITSANTAMVDPSLAANIYFDVSDISQLSIGSPTVLFVNCVCFSASLIHALTAHLTTLPNDAIVVSVSRRLPSPDFDHISTLTLPANGLGRYGDDGEDFTFYFQQHRKGLSCDVATSASPSVTDTIYSAGLRTHVKFTGLVAASMSSPTAMITMSQILTSESTTRMVLDDTTLLDQLATMCSLQELTLPQRAGVFMLLFAISVHPTGAQSMAIAYEADGKARCDLIANLFQLLSWESNDALKGCLISTLSNLLVVHQNITNTAVWAHGLDLVRRLGADNIVADTNENLAEAVEEFEQQYHWVFEEKLQVL
eukprot:m.266735 g.266735  ORF g.266735 m.266735 type:complete len:514 (+) comp69040_c0_seq1:105-1646(+)